MEDKIYDILIIGGGSAGITAAIYAKRAGRDVAIIEKFALGGQMNLIGKIENYPGFASVDGIDLSNHFSNHAKSQGITIIAEEGRQFNLDGRIKEIVCNKNTYFAYAVIFAMGSHSRELGIDGEAKYRGSGVSYCAICDGNFFKGKQVAVVGSGDSAFSDADYLKELCSHVYVLTKDKLKLHNYTENQFEKSENVTLLKGAYSQKIQGTDSVQNLIYIKDGKEETLSVDGVFVAIGRTPDTEKLKNILALDERGYIIADEKMKTSIEGVFACGDVRKNDIKQISTAVGEGAIAGTEASKYAILAKLKGRK